MDPRWSPEVAGCSEDKNQAVTHSPPIPKKLVDKIWRNEFIELSELLPACLGIPHQHSWMLLHSQPLNRWQNKSALSKSGDYDLTNNKADVVIMEHDKASQQVPPSLEGTNNTSYTYTSDLLTLEAVATSRASSV